MTTNENVIISDIDDCVLSEEDVLAIPLLFGCGSNLWVKDVWIRFTAIIHQLSVSVFNECFELIPIDI
ncbi:MAG: hypothetical protein QXV42_01340 [Ignisphaera sp.]